MSGPGVAVVTGAASGIGAGIAFDLRERGWRVGGLDRTPADGADWADRLDAAVQVDMADPAAVDAAVGQLADRLGPITAAVSAAGHYEMVRAEDISVAQWQRMLRVHLGGFIGLVRAVLPRLVPGGDRSLVAVSSELAVGGGSEDAHYAAAKGAVLGVVRSLAVELAPRGVRVNAVAPGPTDTPLLAADSPWRAPDYLATLPTRALARPEDVARCVRFLLEDGTFCTGETLNPNSGAVI